jgi:outer membrane biosynthesis protein TonB
VAAVKWIFVVLFGIGSAGALALAFLSGGEARAATARTAPQIVLREFPTMIAMAGTVKPPDVAAKPTEPETTKPAEPEVAKTPEPEAAKTPEPVAAKTPEPVAAKPEPVAAKPAPVAAKPEPVAAQPKPEPVAAKPEPKPEPVAAAPKPEPVAAAPKAPPAEGILNLRASDTADVFLDGKKLGGSPLLGIKAKVGNHKVRFDCYDAAGNTVAGPAQTIAVKADGEVDVEYPCPVE